MQKKINNEVMKSEYSYEKLLWFSYKKKLEIEASST